MDNNANVNLMDAIDRIKKNNDENSQMWFLYNLVNSKLILPVVIDTIPDADGNVAENTKVRYFSIKNTDDKLYLVTFTNTDYFQEWQPDIMKYHVKYDYSQVEQIVTGQGSEYDGFIIDPNHGNVAIENDTLKRMTRSLPHDMAVQADRIVTENNMGLTPVNNPPQKLINALKEFMSKEKSILSAHIMQTIRKGEKTPTLILVIDFLGSAQRVFDDVARVAQNNMETPQPIGIMPAYDKVAMKYIENVEPFYKK